MKLRYPKVAALLSCVIVINIFLSQGAAAQTRLTLHVTQEELNIWKQRAVSGPYKDGWDRIKRNADAFKASPNGVWAGQTSDNCWAYPNTPGTHGHRDTGLRDSAFAYLLTADSNYLKPVLNQLLAQAATAGTDFRNATRWCNTSNHFSISNWLRILLYGYSYIRSSISAGNQASLDIWFIDAANFATNRYTRLLELLRHRRLVEIRPNECVATPVR